MHEGDAKSRVYELIFDRVCGYCCNICFSIAFIKSGTFNKALHSPNLEFSTVHFKP